MTSDILNILIRANLAGGAAILVVLALRIPARRAFGPEVAYRLWTAPVLAAAATLIPRIAPGAVHKSLGLAAFGASPTWVAVAWLAAPCSGAPRPGSSRRPAPAAPDLPW
jgi:beta-lactamase regulating signal transducer with metallopeptidase domain